ncbi:LLM class F420-dependent oxidoreductase [Microtetraspora sp. NBRC 13810]|uniref:TIGR03620 family F420-dependent LLM class oxidoreductase n=1 Tax=Microtetraspora sp. NBRC 13810 TaxID=3030990 RepID=UPI0024A50728|nr:TIGR03620 family F420-dependent LLM class oxidoreductase [Microtetraspora sp. NBRC 13810]GLW07207.1 LLM class F420-dependent oxidoreductase [Microtetraspora sp. NBRC 13810]
MSTGNAFLGKIGIWSGVWSSAQHSADPARISEIGEAAAELEDLGYGTIWVGGSPPVGHAAPLLEATSRIKVATGILSIWEHEAAGVAARRAELERAHPGRFVLGLGVSHSHFTPQYERPYTAMLEYLSALDAAPEPVPAGARVLAALGPRMLELSRDRAAGAHPYLVTAEHTAQARAILGDRAVLAPELKVVLGTDLDAARALARAYLSFYLAMPNYTGNLTRLGFGEDDYLDGGSDRLLDAVFAFGDADAVAARAAEFLAAGADHLAIQVVTGDPRNDLPREAWRRLAETLPLDG